MSDPIIHLAAPGDPSNPSRKGIGGPKTEAGKARSSQNAILHGLTSKQPHLVANENPAAWLHHLTQYHSEHQPLTLTEADLVDDIAWTRWQKKRLSRIQAGVLTLSMLGPDFSPEPDSHLDPGALELARAFLAQSGPEGALAVLNRYEARISREYHRTLKTLLDLQSSPNRPSSPSMDFLSRHLAPNSGSPLRQPGVINNAIGGPAADPQLPTPNSELPTPQNPELPNELPPDFLPTPKPATSANPDSNLFQIIWTALQPFPEAWTALQIAIENDGASSGS